LKKKHAKMYKSKMMKTDSSKSKKHISMIAG